MRTYRIHADSWTTLKDILVGTPEDFNEDLSSYYDARNGIDRYRGTLRGRTMGAGFPIPNDNWLSGETRGAFFQDWNAGRITYIVWSYNTPIAWRTIESKWVMPDVTYTRTTSKHQGKVATALSQITGGI